MKTFPKESIVEIDENCGIYFLKWNNCEYFYVGQSFNLKIRNKKHERDLRKQIHFNDKLQNVYNKYGNFEFIVIENCTESKLTEREQHHLDLLFSNEFCCNMSPTAESVRGFKHSDEIKAKTKAAILKTGRDWTGSNNPNYGRKITKENSEKQSALCKLHKFGKDKSKKVIDCETFEIYESAYTVSLKFTNIKYSTLRSNLNGTNHNNTKFKYFEKWMQETMM